MFLLQDRGWEESLEKETKKQRQRKMERRPRPLTGVWSLKRTAAGQKLLGARRTEGL